MLLADVLNSAVAAALLIKKRFEVQQDSKPFAGHGELGFVI